MKNRLSFTIIFVILLSTFTFFIFSAFNKVSKNTKNTDPHGSYTIIVDAGHGGEDGGAIGIDNILEKDINLDIALFLNDYLKITGIKTRLIRESDVSIYSENAKSLREKKNSDLKNRLEIFNSNDKNIVVSIHQNKFEQSKYYGTQIFFSKNNPESRILAENIKNSVVSLLQPDNKREIKPADKNIYLLYNSKVPSIIVECGFISNPHEAELLTTENYKKDIAFAIYCGILDYFDSL